MRCVMSFDNLCKLLAEKHSDCFAAWLLGELSTTPIEVLKTELSIEPIRADSVTLLQTRGQILHHVDKVAEALPNHAEQVNY